MLLACCRSVIGQLQEAADARSAAEAERDQLSAEKEQLMPQLEQARWQNRQLERKLEEAVAGRSKAEEVCWALMTPTCGCCLHVKPCAVGMNVLPSPFKARSTQASLAVQHRCSALYLQFCQTSSTTDAAMC